MRINESDTPQEIADKLLEALKVDLASRGIDLEAIKNAPAFGHSLQMLFDQQMDFNRFYDICRKISIFNHGL